jgi:DNA-damage-inducible protein J
MIMLAATSITFRTDDEIKRRAVVIFNDLGMDMSTGVNVLLRALVRENGFPFSVSLDPNTEYREWMKQKLQKSWETRKDPNRKRYLADEVWNKLGLDV